MILYRDYLIFYIILARITQYWKDQRNWPRKTNKIWIKSDGHVFISKSVMNYRHRTGESRGFLWETYQGIIPCSLISFFRRIKGETRKDDQIVHFFVGIELFLYSSHVDGILLSLVILYLKPYSKQYSEIEQLVPI